MGLGTKESQGIILSGSWLVVLENVATLAKYVSHGPLLCLVPSLCSLQLFSSP